LAATVSDLNKSNLRLMACTGLEEDVGDIVASGTKYDRNAETLMTISDVLAVEGGTLPSLQLKMTAFMPAELLTKITTIFNNGEISMKDFVEEIHRKGGETDFPQLTPIENEALRLGMRRLYKIGFRAKESGVRLLVDAEYTYMNPGISVGALAMMLALNRDGQVRLWWPTLTSATSKTPSTPSNRSQTSYLATIACLVQKLSAVLTWRKRGCVHLSRDTQTQSMTHTRTPASCMTGW